MGLSVHEARAPALLNYVPRHFLLVFRRNIKYPLSTNGNNIKVRSVSEVVGVGEEGFVEILVGGKFMKFVIRGRQFDLSREDIEASLKDIEPEGRSKYQVMINGKAYPIKQVLSRATCLAPIGFTSQDAYRILSRLGYEIKQST